MAVDVKTVEQLVARVGEAIKQLGAGEDLEKWDNLFDELPVKAQVAMMGLVHFVADMNQKNHGRNARLTAHDARLIPLEACAADVNLETDSAGRVLLAVRKGDGTVQRQNISVTDQKVWRHGAVYVKGDGVTHDRSFWIAQVDRPNGRPGTTHDWRLAVAKGRDGKDVRDEVAEAAR